MKSQALLVTHGKHCMTPYQKMADYPRPVERQDLSTTTRDSAGLPEVEEAARPQGPAWPPSPPSGPACRLTLGLCFAVLVFAVLVFAYGESTVNVRQWLC